MNKEKTVVLRLVPSKFVNEEGKEVTFNRYFIVINGISAEVRPTKYSRDVLKALTADINGKE